MLLQKSTQFWLKIRPAYIIENFDSLISYLRTYTYDVNRPENNSDYDSTVDTMLEMSVAYADSLLSSPFKLPDLDIDSTLLVRLLGATVLACKKREQTTHRVILGLISLLTRLNTKYTEEELISLSAIARDTALGMPLVSAGISYLLLEAGSFSLQLVAHRLLSMKFKADEASSQSRYVEGKGLLMLRADKVVEISPSNFADYQASRNELLLEVPGLVRLTLSDNQMGHTNNFKNYLATTSHVLHSIDAVRPSPRQPLREYTPTDRFMVEVTEKRGALIIGRTISPTHVERTGKINLQPTLLSSRPSRFDFQAEVMVGDCLRVTLDPSDEFEFRIGETFETFYRTEALQYSDTTAPAIFEGEYQDGYTFVTEEGVRMSIYGGNVSKFTPVQHKAFNMALNENVCVKVFFQPCRYTVDDAKFILYGFIDRDGIIYDHEGDSFTVEQANRNMVAAFLDDCCEEGADIKEHLPEPAEPIESLVLTPLLSILYRLMTYGFDDARTRLEYATAGCVLARILDYPEAYAYFKAQRKVVAALTDFARGNRMPEVEIEADALQFPDVAEDRALMHVLAGYRLDAPGDAPASGEDLVSKVQRLVDASNSLRDIIDRRELISIKRIITRALGVEDEFVGQADDRTFYGIESDRLEFKSSIVFPPSNRRRMRSAVADPLLQRWAIIRTVCGLLNSRFGGDLLLGVRDTGYAIGLADDIAALASLGLIPFKSADSYRTYVQNIIDESFCIEGTSEPSASITRSTVIYSLETNQEGLDILRIKVSPYKGGVVAICKTPDRPAFIEDVYERMSGRTIASNTPELRAHLLQNKK